MTPTKGGEGDGRDEISTPSRAGEGEQGEVPESSRRSPKASVTYNVPNPAVTYGGISPEIEETTDDVSDVGAPKSAIGRLNIPGSHKGAKTLKYHSILDVAGSSGGVDFTVSSRPSDRDERPSWLLNLPSELIDLILSYMSPLELAVISRVCRSLCHHSFTETHWHRHVLSNLPNNHVTSPYPCKSWRELYISHDPHWFLTKHKIWFCDRQLTGQMVIVRYDQRRGCIEGYQLLATRNRDGSEPWLHDQDVHIHYFEPKVKLHLDKPILQFNADSLENLVRNARNANGMASKFSRHFFAEQPMRHHHGTDPRFSNFLLAKPLPHDALVSHMTDKFPYGYVWPPPLIPAHHRVAGHPVSIPPASASVNHARLSSSVWTPCSRSETSEQTFRIRTWMEMGPSVLGLHFGEEIMTYSTLDPALYTPTPSKPWRGIWVGDYSGHGCEFLLVHQPDESEEGAEAPLERLDDETEQQFEARFLTERVYRGRLEAIKITGDPNLPRGEFTFVADDLSDAGLVGVAQEPPFQGARVVRSRGHVANLGFVNDKFIESQLLLLSHNRLAQYWVDFGHISFFERVDIDQFLRPE